MRIQRVETLNLNNSKKQKTTNPNFQRNWEEHISWGANYIKETGKTNFKLFSFPDAKAVFVEVADKAAIGLSGIRERLVSVIGLATAAATGKQWISSIDKDSKIYPMENKGNGIFEANKIDAKPDDKYRFVVVTKDNDINLVKDPYAKKQESIQGWSSIYDKDKYEWKNTDWLEGKDPRRIVRKPNEPLRGLENLVINEVNIPTLSKEGTFEAAKAQIEKIANNKTATAIEIMPVENTFSKQWGYDGVDKLAVNEQLGGADKLKELIDFAHGKGLNVIIDMVPNHMGPDGDYLEQTGPYIKSQGEFGNQLNYEGKDNKYVRDWMTNAALMWAKDFNVDGIRFDLTEAVESDFLLRQIALELNEHAPNVFLIAEDHQNKRDILTKYYEDDKTPHEEQIESIDNSIQSLSEGKPTAPWNIGFDSEWDSDYKEYLSNMALTPNSYLLDKLDKFLPYSHYRIKYAYSHDEIGNYDGTRFIAKYLNPHFDLYSSAEGNDEAEKGQNAAKISQRLAELIVSEKFVNMNDEELANAEKEVGLKKFIAKKDLIDGFKTAVAKNKLLLGTVMTTPGPKMYFQGDEQADLSYFKFFREFSNEKEKRAESSEYKDKIIKKKGYDTLESIARNESIVGSVDQEHGLFRSLKTEMNEYSADLLSLVEKYPAIAKGEVNSTYKDNNHNVHIHQLKLGDEEFIVLKNFGTGFHNKTYEYYGFPQNSTWEEIFNSDDPKYGGEGFTNKDRKDITNLNQHLSMAPNSIVILKKI